MAETFYSVLGVDRHADTQTIKQAYREKVKDHHPDVSDAADAEETFKRLTDARDVLVDASSRQQYDRVGHREYVRRYLDSNAWSVDGTDSTGGARGSGTGTAGGAAGGRNGRSHSGGSNRSSASNRDQSGTRSGPRGRSGRSGDDSSTAKDYQRYKSGYSPEEDDWDAGTDSPGGSGSGTGRSGTSPGDGRGGTSTSDRAWTDDFDTGTSSAKASTTRNSNDPRQRARKDQWQTAHAAANAYSPSGREPPSTGRQQTGIANVADAARQVGPWLAFHFVFLISAFVTVWLFVTWTPSIPSMFVSILLLGVTIFFSILHMISRVYS